MNVASKVRPTVGLAQPEGTWRPFRAPSALRPFFPRPAEAGCKHAVAAARPMTPVPDPSRESALA